MKSEASEVLVLDFGNANERENPKGLDNHNAIDSHDVVDEGDDDIVTTTEDDEANDYINKVENGDTQRVIRLRMLLILSLATSAIVMSYFVHKYIATHEKNKFHNVFYNDANKVMEAVGSSLKRSLTTLNAFALAYVSHAATVANYNSNSDDANITWPFVTLPNFALLASKLLPLTDGVFVSMQPIVCLSQKAQWEEYSLQNDYWVNETLSVQEIWDGYYGEINYNWRKEPHITRLSPESNVSRCMLPKWQAFPITTQDDFSIYNYDFKDVQPEAIQQCTEKQHAVLSKPFMIPVPDNEVVNAKMKDWSDFFSDFLPPEDEAFEPIFDLYYPIVNDLSRNAVLATGSTNVTAPTVGMLAIPIYWRSLIRNILAVGCNGIVVVVHNACNQPFTYQINGNQVVYLGVGDKHDEKYDDLVVVSKVVDLKSFALRNSWYSGAKIDVDYCPYTLNVYPSDTMKSAFVTKDAIIFAVSVSLIFCFSSCIFILYDRYVERRQQRVKSAVMHSSAIISSLFPVSVQERLFPSSNYNRHASERTDDTSIASPIEGSPIAQEYPDTTVIFADIVGFTAWSSSREPIQVFHLLETLYAGFDALARKFGVYKIETIGDCYVAVVGLPKPRKSHAVVMVKFASAMRGKMMELTQKLETNLGPGTSNLAVRIGLNSGSTTAGVLRGEKARFQLFGDTVNTAARMEASGTPFKIHVSGSTADLIRLAGKGNWLTVRKEQIIVKGKGLMQTYWCEPDDNASFIQETISLIHADVAAEVKAK